MRSNPLFHDSTVSQGSNVLTQFELSHVYPKEGQIVGLKLTVGQKTRYLEMSQKEESVYTASAWIEHRKRISYQFFIQLDGEIISATHVKDSLALHTLIEKWEENKKSDWKKDFLQTPSEVERMDLEFIENKNEDSEGYLDNLIDKWDL